MERDYWADFLQRVSYAGAYGHVLLSAEDHAIVAGHPRWAEVVAAPGDGPAFEAPGGTEHVGTLGTVAVLVRRRF